MIIGLYSPVAQSGKTTVAQEIQKRGYKVNSFAQPLKDMLHAMLKSMGYSEEVIHHYVYVDKEALIPEFKVSARHMLRTLGTEWGRTCVSPSIWIDHWLARVSRCNFTVVDDVRFVNEAELIRNLGGQIWRIVRPGVMRNTTHASEGGLDEWPYFTHEIINGGTLEELLSAIPEIPLGPNGVAPGRGSVDCPLEGG